MSEAERACIGTMGAFLACTMWTPKPFSSLPNPAFSFLIFGSSTCFVFVVVVVVFERLLKGTPTLWEDYVFTGGKPQ